MRLGDVCILVWLWLSSSLAGESFYEILGLEKGAENRAIRRAYKKLAMHYHPDKNKEAGAHERFVKINRAYEVLKDEELRKKYDEFGEEGLKENFPGNGPGPSWQFFQTFGIYDEDTDIATLTRADFGPLVLESGGLWFVNFYSTFCSHCHELAPVWRRVAAELSGIVRVGAVNCGEDPGLCQEQGIQGYPALVLFPDRSLFPGQRSQEAIVAYALDKLPATIHSLRSHNVQALTEEWEPYRGRPWIVQLTRETLQPPLSPEAMKKLALVMEGLGNVAGVDCVKEEDLCEKLGMDEDRRSELLFFPKGRLNRSARKPLQSLDPLELGNEILALLPDLNSVDASVVRERAEMKEPLLLQFVQMDEDVKLGDRKLDALLPQMRVGRLNCSALNGEREACAELNVVKTPCWGMVKVGGGVELHHGEGSLEEVMGFAKAAAAATSLRMVLGKEDFETMIASTAERPWLIDFFAPWCPPCRRLIPEIRKASQLLGDRMGFATLDCTLHAELCAQAKVASYPTSVLFNASAAPAPFVGLHDAAAILEFIADLEAPPVEILSPDSFREKVEGRAEGTTWIVDFYAPWCGPCQQLAPEFRKLAKLIQAETVRLGSIDCEAYGAFCMAQRIQGYPAVWLYPRSLDGAVEAFQGFQRDHVSLSLWASAFLPSIVETFDEEGFMAMLSSQEVWLVDFYAVWCGPCQIFAPQFEAVGRGLAERGVRVAKVDCDAVAVCPQAGIQAYPSLRLYTGAVSDEQSQEPMGALHIGSQNPAQIIAIVSAHLDALEAQTKSTPPEKTEL